MFRFILIILAMIFHTQATASETLSHWNVAEMLQEADAARSSDPQRFEALLKQFENSNIPLSLDQIYFLAYLRAYHLSWQGLLDQAVDVYADISQNARDKNLAFRAQASIVNNLAVKRDYYNGSLAILRLNELKAAITDQDLIYLGYGTSATFYNQTGQYQKAKALAEKLIDGSPSERLACIGYEVLIETQYYLTPQTLHYGYFDDSIEFCRAIDEDLVASVIAVFKAKLLADRGEHRASLDYLMANKNSIFSASYHWATAQYFLTAAKNAFLLGDIATADSLAQSGLSATEKIGHAKPKVEIYELLSLIAEANGDFAAALNFMKMYSEAEKAYLDDIKVRELAIQQVHFESVEKTNKIELLDKENDLLRTKSVLAEEQANNNRLALMLACCVVMFLFYWVYRSRRLQIQLRTLAQVDDLTGICNRSFFNTQALQTLKWLKQSKQPISFILFDLDHFKKVNDTWGHQAGDWVLRKAVSSVKTVCRNNDIIGRMGGEEFAILLPGCTIDKAIEIADMCRRRIQAVDTAETGEKFTISASFGVSDNYHCSYQLEKLFAGADTALYQAKRAGRNQIKTYRDDHEPLAV